MRKKKISLFPFHFLFLFSFFFSFSRVYVYLYVNVLFLLLLLLLYLTSFFLSFYFNFDFVCASPSSTYMPTCHIQPSHRKYLNISSCTPINHHFSHVYILEIYVILQPSHLFNPQMSSSSLPLVLLLFRKHVNWCCLFVRIQF